MRNQRLSDHQYNGFVFYSFVILFLRRLLKNSMPVIKHILICFFIAVSLSQYTLVKTFENIAQQPITDATFSTTGEFLYVKTNTTYNIYNSTYNLYQNGTGMPYRKFEVSDNAFTQANCVWNRKTHDFQILMNVSGMLYSTISKNGLVVAAFSSTYKFVSLWFRSTANDNFTLNSIIPTNETTVDVKLNYDGSLLVAATVSKLQYYKFTQGTYKIFDMFIHSFSYSLAYPQVLTFDNFNIVAARDIKKIKFFQLVDSAYQLYKTVNFSNITDWSADGDYLLVKEADNVNVWKRSGVDFVQVQNVATTAIMVGAKNGTLVTANGTTIMVWKSKSNGEGFSKGDQVQE